MKKLTQSQLIVKFLESRYPEYVYGYELVKLQTPKGWIGSSGDRRARELAEEGKIEAVHEGKYVKYRFIPEEPENVKQLKMIQVMSDPRVLPYVDKKKLVELSGEAKQLSLI